MNMNASLPVVAALAAVLSTGCGEAGGAAKRTVPGPAELSATAEVKALPATTLVFAEQVGGFQGAGEVYDVLLDRILAWAEPAGQWNFPETTRIVSVYPDGDEVPPERQRLWFGITADAAAAESLPEGLRAMTLSAGDYAVGSFRVREEEFGAAWGWMYSAALEALGVRPGDGYAFEVQRNDSSEDAEQRHEIDICVPVVR